MFIIKISTVESFGKYIYAHRLKFNKSEMVQGGAYSSFAA